MESLFNLVSLSNIEELRIEYNLKKFKEEMEADQQDYLNRKNKEQNGEQ